MQDFAKNTSVVDRELAQPVGEWKLDALSVLFGVLLGAIVVFTWLKMSECREMQPTINQEINETVVEDTSLQFQFYTELKKNDLYPAFNE